MKSISLPGKNVFIKCACFCFFVLVVIKPKPQPTHRGINTGIETTTRGPVIKYLLEDFSNETVYC
jgi:hypothetical protein